MNVSINDFNTIDLNQFKDSIASGQELIVSFPIPSIGFSNSRIDIIGDLRDVSFCCEKVANFISVIDSNFVTRDKYYLCLFRIQNSPKLDAGLTNKGSYIGRKTFLIIALLNLMPKTFHFLQKSNGMIVTKN